MRKEGSWITVLKGWMDRRIAIPYVAAAIIQFLDYFLDFYDIEATHVRREENCFFVVLIACGVLSPFGILSTHRCSLNVDSLLGWPWYAEGRYAP